MNTFGDFHPEGHDRRTQTIRGSSSGWHSHHLHL